MLQSYQLLTSEGEGEMTKARFLNMLVGSLIGSALDPFNIGNGVAAFPMYIIPMLITALIFHSLYVKSGKPSVDEREKISWAIFFLVFGVIAPVGTVFIIVASIYGFENERNGIIHRLERLAKSEI